jgi:hypothetical protein
VKSERKKWGLRPSTTGAIHKGASLQKRSVKKKKVKMNFIVEVGAKTTAPGIPVWSPTTVLTEPSPA